MGLAVGAPLRTVGDCVGLGVGLVGAVVGLADGRIVGRGFGAPATPPGERRTTMATATNHNANILVESLPQIAVGATSQPRLL